MTEMTTMPEGPRPKRVNGKQDKKLGPVLVSGNRLAVHFGVPIEAHGVEAKLAKMRQRLH